MHFLKWVKVASHDRHQVRFVHAQQIIVNCLATPHKDYFPLTLHFQSSTEPAECRRLGRMEHSKSSAATPLRPPFAPLHSLLPLGAALRHVTGTPLCHPQMSALRHLPENRGVFYIGHVTVRAKALYHITHAKTYHNINNYCCYHHLNSITTFKTVFPSQSLVRRAGCNGEMQLALRSSCANFPRVPERRSCSTSVLQSLDAISTMRDSHVPLYICSWLLCGILAPERSTLPNHGTPFTRELKLCAPFH